MGNKKVSYTSLYNQLEDFYLYMAKESLRYSTLLKRANKVGGDRRMEKVILMPVYNKMVSETLSFCVIGWILWILNACNFWYVTINQSFFCLHEKSNLTWFRIKHRLLSPSPSTVAVSMHTLVEFIRSPLLPWSLPIPSTSIARWIFLYIVWNCQKSATNVCCYCNTLIHRERCIKFTIFRIIV